MLELKKKGTLKQGALKYEMLEKNKNKQTNKSGV